MSRLGLSLTGTLVVVVSCMGEDSRRSPARERQKKAKVSCSLFSEQGCRESGDLRRTRGQTKNEDLDTLTTIEPSTTEKENDQDVLAQSPASAPDQLLQNDGTSDDTLLQDPVPADVITTIPTKTVKYCSRIDIRSLTRILESDTNLVYVLLREESGRVLREPAAIIRPEKNTVREDIINVNQFETSLENIPDGRYHALLCHEDKLHACYVGVTGSKDELVSVSNGADPKRPSSLSGGLPFNQFNPARSIAWYHFGQRFDYHVSPEKGMTGVVGFSNSILPFVNSIVIENGKVQPSEVAVDFDYLDRDRPDGYVGRPSGLTQVKYRYVFRPQDMWVFYGRYHSAPYSTDLPDINRLHLGCHAAYTPLIIDLDNIGSITLSPPFPGTKFDITAAGKAQPISWPESRAAFLAIDLNGNKRVDDGSELFGAYSALPGGARAENGFLALQHYDANADTFIDEQDPVFSRLLLWTDTNMDGFSQVAELRSVSDSPIRYIDLEYVEIDEVDKYGNETRQRSVVAMADGSQRLIFDIWFRNQ